MSLIIGIDPGQSGGVAWFCSVSNEYGAIPMPASPRQFKVLVEELSGKYGIISAYLEKPQAMGRLMSQSTIFSFAQHYGVMIGVLTCLNASINEVSPIAWKKKMKVTKDKNTSIVLCEKLYPLIDLFPGRCKKGKDGLAEAALIMHYGRTS